jgi:hypothetical protein
MLDGKTFVSPPQSLLSQVSGAGPNCSTLAASLPVRPHVHCAFDLRVDTAPQSYMDFFVFVIYAPGIEYYEVALAFDPLHVVAKEAQVETDGGYVLRTTPVPPPAAPFSQWNHVVLDVDLNAGRATASVGGGSDGVLTLQYAPTQAAATGFGIHVGIPYATTPYLAAVRDDNLVCDVTP